MSIRLIIGHNNYEPSQQQKMIANQSDKEFMVQYFKKYGSNFNYIAGIVNSSSILKLW